MSRESAVTTNSLIEQLVSRASGAEAGSGNRIEILLDSTENFPAWEAAMLAAEESICIEMYIFADNAFGRRVRDILLEKLSQGVTVVLAYDWLGCLPAHLTGFFRPLREAGAHITAYNP
ncbi:MAG: cardiolipin synthase B, partial [Neisseria elongata]